MSETPMNAPTHHFEATLVWRGTETARGAATHPDPAYTRDADLAAPGKPIIGGSAPSAFGGDDARYSPEDLLMLSLSECHMLTFLALASKKRLTITRYVDRVTGTLGMATSGTPGIPGKMSMQEVVLHPEVEGGGLTPDVLAAMHQKAHANCFMANSVNFPVRVSLS
jgi:organic hydroperoxide reductase OsmC/OhrA